MRCENKCEPKNPLSEMEWTLIWSSMRYFLGRQTIASVCYPEDIIKNYYKRLQSYQRDMLVQDIKSYQKKNDKIGDMKIDDIVWKKFMAALDTSTHFIIKHKGKTHMCFELSDKVYSLKTYVKNPGKEIYFDPSYIKLIRAIKRI